jgi:LysR family transcriptional regulator, glycine cleavage system transcriptional activator
MSRRYYNLPPLTTLSAFEAAARHLSFKDAAQELSVTPGAVSHQIKALEGELNTPLFQRHHRGVALTADGLALFDTLSTSFLKVSQSLNSIRDRNATNEVTIGSTTAVAAQWLSPTLTRFWRQYPDQEVFQVAQDRVFHARPEIDLFIRYGRDSNSAMEQTPLYRDQLVPVACPKMAKELENSPLPDLARQRLIHLEAEDANWTSWHEWFGELGYLGSITSGQRVNRYSVALQAAQDGAGLVLGWQRLIAPLIDAGKLAPIRPHVLPAPHQFYLVGHPDADASDGVRALKDWIINEVQKDGL